MALRKDKNGKWYYVEPKRPAIAQKRIQQYLDYLKTCIIVQDPVIGECYKTNNPQYWQYKNIYYD